MKRNRFLALVTLLLFVVVAIGIAAAAPTGHDPQPPINGDALTKASAAALEYTGGGRVTETEIGDEDGYYEIEVTLDDGSQVDVHLDENFNVIGHAARADHDGPNDQDGPGDK